MKKLPLDTCCPLLEVVVSTVSGPFVVGLNVPTPSWGVGTGVGVPAWGVGTGVGVPAWGVGTGVGVPVSGVGIVGAT